MNKEEIESYRKAGKIVKEVKEYAKTIVKPGVKLLEIAEKIEEKILELGGKPAFPVTLGVNEFTAHVTPEHNNEETAKGLIKVDFGVHINGFSADNSFSIDLDNNDTNTKLIDCSKKALEEAIQSIKEGKTIGEIGQVVQDTAEGNGFSPIRNLSGHSIEENELHAGINIPNFNNKNPNKLSDGVYAIEPFITNGMGEVYDGKPSGIYQLEELKNVRDNKARELLAYIEEEYNTLPFCSRWLVKKFGTRALISLRMLESAGVLHHFDQLIEKSKSPVAQTEATILINEGKVEILTD